MQKISQQQLEKLSSASPTCSRILYLEMLIPASRSPEYDGRSLWMKADGNGGHVEGNDRKLPP
ncbi:hypothetical protein EYF80_042466 [Liparis tanakae]|uniref:Uncharacterized protein n=1 Tax=Liparis tanakae TaxID=230148 RepID=A0A4Z2G1E5_9TELE|nr:hypothetical protein EYF80_042466 [Liparis tanakae]